MENEEIVSNPTWIDEGWQKALDILNQPFVIAILVAVIIGIFLVILFRSTSLSKKSIQRQDDKIKAQDTVQANFIKKANNDFSIQNQNLDTYKETISNGVKDFMDNEKEFKSLTIKCLSRINNIQIKKILEEYDYGKEQETKDDQTTGE